MDLYSYVGDDPMNRTDPTGTFGVADVIVVGIIGMGIYMAVDSAEKGQKMNMAEEKSKIDDAVDGKEHVTPNGPTGTDIIKAGTLLADTAQGMPKGIPKTTTLAKIKITISILKAVLSGHKDESKKDEQKKQDSSSQTKDKPQEKTCTDKNGACK